MKISRVMVPLGAAAIMFAACGVASGPAADQDGVQLPAATPPAETGAETGPPRAPEPGREPAAPPADPPGPVGVIERADVLVPGFVTITGWADVTAETGSAEVNAWLDLEPVGSVMATDPWSSESGERIDAGFAFDLPVQAGTRVICITTAPDVFEPLDCVELDVATTWQSPDDEELYLTALTPIPDGSVRIRGVAPARDGDGPTRVDVSSDTGRVTTVDDDTVVTQVDVTDQSFRFEVGDLDAGTWAVCVEGALVSIRERIPTPSAADGCGTVVIGELHVGTTGRVLRIDAVAPPPGHPLSAMERDGGVSVELRDGSTMWFFGDSMEQRADKTIRFFVNNTAAWTAAEAPLVTRDAATDEAKPFLFASPPEGTCATSREAALWPESAVAIPQADGTDRVIVVMSKVCVDPSSWLDIELVGYAVAEVTYDPADPPADRPIVGQVTQPNLADDEAGYGRALLLEPDGFLYGYQCGNYPDQWGPCRVGRVATGDITDTTAWRFWNGGDWTNAANWVTDRAAAAGMQLPDPESNTLPVAAFGVTHDHRIGAHLMTYSPWPAFCGEITVRVAMTPVGPWTSPVPITLPGCVGEVRGLDPHCYTATPQMQLCGPDEFGGGYFDMLTESGLGQYFTFVIPFVVVPAER